MYTKKNKYCLFCGKELVGKQTKYCSIACCHKELYRIQQSFNERHKRYCLLCGKELTSLKRIYCSEKCAKEAIKRRKQNEREQTKIEEQEIEKEIESWAEKKPKVNVTLTFADIEKGMKETGLSYGEYVARYDK